MTDLFSFHDLGLDIVDHDTDNDDFFEQISWEQINNYPADLIMVDQRTPGIMDELAGITVWNSLPAVNAKQTGPWYAAAPYSYGRIVPIVREMTRMVGQSRSDVV